MSPPYIIFGCVIFFLYVWVFYNTPIVAVGVKHLRRIRRESKVPRSETKELPTFSIIVPVKDEEKVLGRLLEALRKLDYPPEKRKIILVEDGSVDNTARICREHTKRHPSCVRFLCRPISNGKPSALNNGLIHAEADIVAVFDADNVPEPNALLKAAEYFQNPSVAAVQGNPCFINADENRLTKIISYEEAARFEAYYQGKDILSLFVPLTGTCQFIRRRVLKEVGGWNEDSLSEDIEMSAKLTEKNYRIKYAPDVKSWQENPSSLKQLIRQRTRWFRGCMEVALKYGRLLARPTRKNIDAEIALAAPFFMVSCLISYLVTLFALLVPIQPSIFTIMAQAISIFTTLALLLLGVSLIYITKPRKLSNLLWLPFVYGYWFLQTLIASYALIQMVLRRPKRWVKTARTGVVTNAPRPGGTHALQNKRMEAK